MIARDVFTAEVRRALAGTLEGRGYRLLLQDGHRVLFVKPPLFVDVAYDPRSTELSVWFGTERDSEPPLELSDMARAAAASAHAIAQISTMQVREPAALRTVLGRVRSALERCPSLLDDQVVLERARKLRSHRARAYTRQVAMRPVLEAADAAWTSKDFARVRELLEPVRESLDARWMRRLAYSKRKLS